MADYERFIEKGINAATADRHALYERSVQNPELEITFVDQVFKSLGREPAKTLREDFCGTAWMCAEWVKSNPKSRTAVGLDIDKPTLKWGTDVHLAPLGKLAERVSLRAEDVRTVRRNEKFDAICAYNYSYSVFKTRDELRGYFEAVRKSLGPNGLFFLDAWGGWEANQELSDLRKYKHFTYQWEQASFNPIDHRIVCHITFKFRDKSKLKHAFTYDWRFWTLPELQELLIEAGFKAATVYWEEEDEKREGTGVFKPQKVVPNDPGWNAYVVGSL